MILKILLATNSFYKYQNPYKNHINQLGVKSKYPPLKKAIQTPKAKLKRMEIIKRRSENNSPPENGRLTPIDLENCRGFIFVK